MTQDWRNELGAQVYGGMIQIKALVRQPQKWRMAFSKLAFDILGVAGIISIILGVGLVAYGLFFY